MAKRNTMRLDLSGFSELITKLDKLGGDIKNVTEEALEQAGKTIGDDTVEAVQKPYLPAGGKYSTGRTEESVVRNPKVEWNGMTASIGVGFDYSKSGAGGFLISGTPKMKPDAQLQKIYKRKQYMQKIQSDMGEVIGEKINEKMGG